MITCTRYHDFSAGHRVYGHEGKCNNLHGHNYRVYITCKTENLDLIGRVIDFSCIKSLLCNWLEDNWDHKFLMWEKDPLSRYLVDIDETVVITEFNPTAENMAQYLLKEVFPTCLKETCVTVTEIIIEETRKCSAKAIL